MQRKLRRRVGVGLWGGGLAAASLGACSLFATLDDHLGQQVSPDDASTASDGNATTEADTAVDSDARPIYDAGPTPSCTATDNICGTPLENCCATAVVKGNFGGTPFYRGYDPADAGYTNRDAGAFVHDFALDKYEVTVGRFRRWLEEYPASKPLPGSGKNIHDPKDTGWEEAWTGNLLGNRAAIASALHCGTDSTWTDTSSLDDAKAINCVTWYEALAFCIWDGGRLPTEAEWHYAASGGNQQRAYPWSQPPGSLAIDGGYAVYSTPGTGVARVGSRPRGVGVWGQYDLGGNLNEWVRDWYGDYPFPCTDCAALDPTKANPSKVFRGGSFANTESSLRTEYRSNIASPDSRSYPTGFRCARNL